MYPISRNIMAILFFFLILVFYHRQSAGVALQLNVLLLALPICYLYVFKKIKLNIRVKKATIVSLLFGAMLLLNVLLNNHNYRSNEDAVFSIVLVLNVFYIMLLGSFLLSLDKRFMINVFIKYAILCSIFFIYLFIFEIDWFAGRQSPNMIHPNWWGMIAFGTIFTSSYLNNGFIRSTFYLISMTLILLTSARGALVSSILYISLFEAYVKLKEKKIKKVIILLIWFFSGLVVMDYIFFDFRNFYRTEKVILHEVFLIDDFYRGLDTGISGRIEDYKVAINDWADNPIFGIGYGNSRKTHNGFLMILAETGVVGFLSFILLISFALVKGIKNGNINQSIYVASYVIFMLTYPRALNVNTTGILFIFSLLNCIYGAEIGIKKIPSNN